MESSTPRTIRSPAISLIGWTFHRQPSPDLGIIFRDAIHNLRSALDHLAVQLVDAGRRNRW
jgi:hypothetical protein